MELTRKIFSFFLDIVETIVVAFCLFIIVYLFFLQPHEVVGNSMLPNFHDKEYILTDKFSYCLRNPERGEIIVFKAPEDPDKDFIKRVIGLSGEKVKIANGKVYINGKVLAEKYLDPDLLTPPGRFLQENQEVVIPANSYIVLGDNRLNSSDSRSWGFITGSRKCGFVGSSGIIGKTLLVYWPFTKFGLVRHVTYD